jgi:hypothetical protein
VRWSDDLVLLYEQHYAARGQRTAGSPARRQSGPSGSVVRPDRAQSQAGRRWVRVAAAVLLLMAGAVGVFRLAAGDGTTTETGSPAGDGRPVIIWPLGPRDRDA